MLLVVKTIDVKTNCWLEKRQVKLPDLEELVALLDLEDFKFNAVYQLEPPELRLLEVKYGFAFSDRHMHGELAVFAREEYFAENIHTGRELLLMLAGTKPLAAFSEEYPLWHKNPISFIPETYFDPYVEAGRFVKRVDIAKQKGKYDIRRVLYAIPDQEWRIDAYLMLWRLCGKHGWNDGFEKAEGYLLGYETEIDRFYTAPSHTATRDPS